MSGAEIGPNIIWTGIRTQELNRMGYSKSNLFSSVLSRDWLIIIYPLPEFDVSLFLDVLVLSCLIYLGIFIKRQNLH